MPLGGAGLALGLSLVLARSASAADPFEPPPERPVIGSCGTVSGGFLLPGTDACLRINGFVRGDAAMRVAEPTFALGAPSTAGTIAGSGRDLQRSSLTTAARLSADVRIPTAYGPVRLYVSLKGARGSHQPGPDR
ncbi:porin [Lichenifustis flavocetrariae]|uniref:Porin n=1 Tax=Lichenifustis flavocetrariae TaxID=2949735 RepID=A0AA41YSD3_9HYPH|nr:porin [Lichenifustis flavocetrariae]MCW6507694.1 porin [Lichenifustis flavocetrariae]